MKQQPLYAQMTSMILAMSLGRMPKMALARGRVVCGTSAAAFIRQSPVYSATFRSPANTYQESRMNHPMFTRCGCGKFQSYLSTKQTRCLSAAAGDSNDDSPMRRASDYDNDFFSSVEPKQTAKPEHGYGFFDGSDHFFEDPERSNPIDDDVASFRAQYQRPLAGQSRREMPPVLSNYDDDGEHEYEQNYNWFDDASAQNEQKDQLEGRAIIKTSARIIQPDQSVKSASKSPVHDSIEGGTIVKTSARILHPDMPSNNTPVTEPRLIKTSARIISTKPTESDSEHQPPVRPRNVVPSFMEPEKTKAMMINTDNVNGRRLTPNMLEASNGSSSTSHATALQQQIEHLRAQIHQLNNGEAFNIDSPKQVSRVLFGEEGRSTNKDTLEALASTGNQMAASIFKYRKVSREHKRELKRMEQMEKGGKKNDYYGNLARQRDESTVGSNSSDELQNNNHRREPLLLIDTSAYIFRSYHAIPPLHHSDGTPTGALHGVCRMLQNLLLTRLLRGERPRVVLAFDSKGDNFRHELYPEYKANRGPCPEDLIPQFELVREAADAFGIVQVQAEGYEADDVIATLARRAVEEGVDVDILSGDKDLMQLITPGDQIPSVHMIDPMHFDRVSHDDVIQKWGVSSDKLGDVLALAGDSSDNIPGAPRIGQKIAASLIDEYGSLEALLEQADGIKQKKRRESLVENADKLLLYRKLVTLDETIPADKMTLPFSFESVSNFRMTTFDPNRLIDFYARLELDACKRQLQNRLRSSWIDYKAPPSPEEYEGIPF